MATLEDIYNQALVDEEERKALAQAMPDAQALAALLEQRGCTATSEEARAFLNERLSRTGELAVEELALVSGGACREAVKCNMCGSSNTEEVDVNPDGVYAYVCKDCGGIFHIVWNN